MEQVYCVIKDNICRLMYNYEFSELVPSVAHLYDVNKEIEIMENNGYIIDTLANAYQNKMTKRVIKVGSCKFSNLEDAAKWCVQKGYSTASLQRIESTLRRNLEGKSKTAYGQVFEYSKEPIEIDKFQIIL